MSSSNPEVRGPVARVVGSRTVYHGVMITLSVIFVVPMLWMVMSSFKTKREIFESPFSLPSSFDLSVWGEAWERGNLGQYVLNSFIVTFVAVSVILITSLCAAYAFSRFTFRFKNLLLGTFVLGLLLPVQSYLTAQSRIFDAFHLLNTRWALIIPYAGLGLALAVFLLKTYMDSLPKELFEAARMDGAGDLRMLTSIVTPLMVPAIATVAVFSVLSSWNEFLLSILYVLDDDLLTIPSGLLAFTGKYSTDYPTLFAALSIITIPMIAIYVVFHRRVIAGVTEGSVQ